MSLPCASGTVAGSCQCHQLLPGFFLTHPTSGSRRSRYLTALTCVWGQSPSSSSSLSCHPHVPGSVHIWPLPLPSVACSAACGKGDSRSTPRTRDTVHSRVSLESVFLVPFSLLSFHGIYLSLPLPGPGFHPVQYILPRAKLP